MVSAQDLLFVAAWILMVVEMLTIGNLHRLSQHLGFEDFSLTGPGPAEEELVAHLAKRALKAKRYGEHTWLVRPMSWVEYGAGSSAHPFCGVGILENEGEVWRLRVRGGIGIALFIGLVAAGLSRQYNPGIGPVGQVIACVLMASVVLVLQTAEARRVFGRIW